MFVITCRYKLSKILMYEIREVFRKSQEFFDYRHTTRQENHTAASYDIRLV
ncbi:protein of unknown function [Candidatus Nitrosotalea okcheonensis]|uniref:Uncharacterized protein n=1 Tax=Candidatus Nitrosotalea okcheonensis TaxID=1903276 RepID=A0A2H1FC74_9ARCH|nr:protein of unknown function [Candidatus Nitrosotalea okcheonensis]